MPTSTWAMIRLAWGLSNMVVGNKNRLEEDVFPNFITKLGYDIKFDKRKAKLLKHLIY